MIAWVWLLATGCGRAVDCTDPATVLVKAQAGSEQALTCEQSTWAISYVELLAARKISGGDRQIAHKAISARFRDDAQGTTSWLEGLRAKGRALASTTGLEGAGLRVDQVWKAHSGAGPIPRDDTALWNVQKRALSVWSSDETSGTALTEADIEAWIQYASLCREAQQGGVLRISVADRVGVYRMVRERFEQGDRELQVAMSSMGPAWEQVEDAWQLASYEDQQEWIAAAPLPPPMTATSLGYAEAVFEGDLLRHASVLQSTLGPFRVGRAGTSFEAL